AGDDQPTTSGVSFNGMLQISFWERVEGSFHRVENRFTTIPITDVDAAGLDFNDIGFEGTKVEYRIVTAVRTTNGKLRLMVWSWRPEESKIELDADSGEQPEPISFLRLHRLANDLYITMVRDDTLDGNKKPIHRLKLITWRIQ